MGRFYFFGIIRILHVVLSNRGNECCPSSRSYGWEVFLTGLVFYSQVTYFFYKKERSNFLSVRKKLPHAQSRVVYALN